MCQYIIIHMAQLTHIVTVGSLAFRKLIVLQRVHLISICLNNALANNLLQRLHRTSIM